MGFDGPEFMDTFLGLFASFTMQYEARIELLMGGAIKREEALEPWTLGLIDMAKSRGGIQPCSQRAIKVFTEASAAVEKLFKTYDAVLSPVMRVPPYKIGWHSPTLDFNTLLAGALDELGYTPLHNAVGTPAMSLPLYLPRGGCANGRPF